MLHKIIDPHELDFDAEAAYLSADDELQALMVHLQITEIPDATSLEMGWV